jgi:hypothetical protein
MVRSNARRYVCFAIPLSLAISCLPTYAAPKVSHVGTSHGGEMSAASPRFAWWFEGMFDEPITDGKSTTTHTPAATASTAPKLVPDAKVYAESMKAAEAVRQKALATTDSAAKKTLYYELTELYDKAILAAPDNDKRSQAVMIAGDTMLAVEEYYPAERYYESIKKIEGVGIERQAQALLGYARAGHIRNEKNGMLSRNGSFVVKAYEAVLDLKGAPMPILEQAHYGIAVIHASTKKGFAAAKAYEAAATLPGQSREASLKAIRLAAQSAKSSHEIAATLTQEKNVYKQEAPLVINRIYTRLIELEPPAQKWQLHFDWAVALNTHGQREAAVTVWNTLAAEKTAPLALRREASFNAAESETNAKNWQNAIVAWNEYLKVPDIEPSKKSLAHLKRGESFANLGKESEAQGEWKALLALPNATPQDEAKVWLEVGLSQNRERATKTKAGAAATELQALATAAQQSFEKSWNMVGGEGETRISALIERANFDAEANNLSAARTWLDKGTQIVNLPSAQAQRLHLTLGILNSFDKKYGEALASLSTALAADSYLYRNNVHAELKTLLTVAVGAKNWDVARGVLDVLGKHNFLQAANLLFEKANLEFLAGNSKAATAHLDSLEQQFAAQLNLEDKKAINALRIKLTAPAVPITP